ncbi:AI-2E family transporter [Sphingomonas xanthus]|uniref:AI-2E family transporter n=1 Tax=Sphingomonas xanthus TaxID=2594473 RepID=A0A516IS35_9SPHN|nr:AI-2E family transporter [Sphingomonas xanthus]QDP19690.1 AI-2E family transporter [Sphingomonas xanthus]
MTEPTDETSAERPGPADLSGRLVREEARRAAVWLGMILAILAMIWLAQPILLIIGGLVFAVILDGGTRLLGRVLPIGRPWRLAIVTLAGFGFIAWTFYFAGTTLAEQAGALRAVVTAQSERAMEYLRTLGLISESGLSNLGNQLLGGVGRLTTALSTAVGVLTSSVLVLVIGIFIAIEPRLYDRGVAWMLPMERRSSFYEISDHVGYTLRRLMAGRILGMVVEGVGTWLMLLWGGVPMAALLGLLTGLLAFIPNIGAIVSGLLMVAVGFSAGTDAGIWAIATYLIVQTVDGYIIVPYVARRTVDLAPALVLAAQLVFGALFGFMGLLLADPIVAAIKTTLEDVSRRKAGESKDARAKG